MMKEFLTTVVLEGLEEKYSMWLCRGGLALSHLTSHILTNCCRVQSTEAQEVHGTGSGAAESQTETQTIYHRGGQVI